MIYWILFVVITGPGGHSVVVERVNYSTEAACLEASQSVGASMNPTHFYGAAFCLKAEQ